MAVAGDRAGGNTRLGIGPLLIPATIQTAASAEFIVVSLISWMSFFKKLQEIFSLILRRATTAKSQRISATNIYSH